MKNQSVFDGIDHTPHEVELGFVVNLRTLRETLKTLNIDGRRWSIASDPHDAIERGYITISHGDDNCIDVLNTLSFHVSVLSRETPWRGSDHILLLFDASSIVAGEPGFYLSKKEIVQDELEDFVRFFAPLKKALIDRMLAGIYPSESATRQSCEPEHNRLPASPTERPR